MEQGVLLYREQTTGKQYLLQYAAQLTQHLLAQS